MTAQHAARFEYDELGLFHENASEFDLDVHLPPVVERRQVDVGDGRHVSALVWGSGAPRLVLLHGGGQNAHTWDTVALALDVPLVAIDLPGHGHSSWRADRDYRPAVIADDVATAMAVLAPGSECLVGMSLGGATSIALTARHPELVRKLVLVDVTPGATTEKARAIIDFISGPPSFPDLDALLQRTVEHHPGRSVSSLRRGILHNAVQVDDGSWRWRYDRLDRLTGHADPDGADAVAAVASGLWDDLSTIRVPMMLVRGDRSPVVDDDDVAEVRRRQPEVRVEVVEGAGHSIQGDRPVELSSLLRDFALVR